MLGNHFHEQCKNGVRQFAFQYAAIIGTGNKITNPVKIGFHHSGSYYYSSIFPVKATDGKFSKTKVQKDFWPETAYIVPIVLTNWLVKAGTDKTTIETVYKDLKVTVKEIKK